MTVASWTLRFCHGLGGYFGRILGIPEKFRPGITYPKNGGNQTLQMLGLILSEFHVSFLLVWVGNIYIYINTNIDISI